MVHIRFQSIHIDALSATSSVNKGTNRIVGRRVTSKENDGLGSIEGDGNIVHDSKHVVCDADQLDLKPKSEKS